MRRTDLAIENRAGARHRSRAVITLIVAGLVALGLMPESLVGAGSAGGHAIRSGHSPESTRDGNRGASASGAAERRHLAVSMGVSLGWGAGSHKDFLHLGDSGWDSYVNGYLSQMHVSWVHLNVPWCDLEPKAGVYAHSVYQAVKSRIDTAAASGKHAFVTVIMDAPVFARRAAMQRDWTGNRLDPAYSGCGRPGVYPGGEAAPKLTKEALRNYADTVGKFNDCFRGRYCSGPDVRSRVLIESGAEENWHAGWQSGICARHSGYGGVPWYATPGNDCGQPGARQMLGGGIGHIETKDARFFGDLANQAARRLHGSLAYRDDVILGGPLFRRNGAGWGTGSVAGSVYLAQALRGGAAGDPWWRPSSSRFWDAAGLHVTVCDSGVRVAWSGCPGSVKQHVEQIRSTLRAAHINVPIWITGATPCSQGGRKPANGHTYKCTAREQARDVQTIVHGLRFHACSDSARPVTLINWFRVVDPDNGQQFSRIGFMSNRSSAPYVPPYIKKAPYRAMAANSNLSCPRR
jgi:hypothetical protein